jgi:hypothetical protein
MRSSELAQPFSGYGSIDSDLAGETTTALHFDLGILQVTHNFSNKSRVNIRGIVRRLTHIPIELRHCLVLKAWSWYEKVPHVVLAHPARGKLSHMKVRHT